jgi:hypothetical protein
VARGAITAHASAGRLDEALAALDRDGSADIPVHVSMRDADGDEVARVDIAWSVKRPAATPAGR